MAANKIKCPECGASIDVSEVLTHNIEEELQKKYEKESNKKEMEFKAKYNEIAAMRVEIEKQQAEIKIKVQSEVDSALKLEKKKIEAETRKKYEKENAELLADKDKELEEKSAQLKDLKKTKAENERLKRDQAALREDLELEFETKMNDSLRLEKVKIKQQAEDEQTLKIKEKEKIIGDLMDQLDEAKRKAEQGSMQLQGEIQELEIEAMLREKFPYDTVTEVKKGQKGADCLHTVRSAQGADCGKIYYESKRTKEYQNGWIQKLKDDNLEVKADVLVIVTQAMPDGESKYFYKDGVWVCSYSEIRWFSFVLRHGLIQLSAVAITQHNKDSKMEMLYNYLTGKEFKGQLEAIIEGFSAIQSGYHDEKKKMLKIWGEREKQLEKIISNTITFYGSLKGIAGASIPDIPMLEDGKTNLLK
jgi:hypothetical protein